MSQPCVYFGVVVSRYIDQGRNPQLYTKECLERALAKNEQVKGKIDTMKVSQEGSQVCTWAGEYPACMLTDLAASVDC